MTFLEGGLKQEAKNVIESIWETYAQEKESDPASREVIVAIIISVTDRVHFLKLNTLSHLNTLRVTVLKDNH